MPCTYLAKHAGLWKGRHTDCIRHCILRHCLHQPQPTPCTPSRACLWAGAPLPSAQAPNARNTRTRHASHQCSSAHTKHIQDSKPKASKPCFSRGAGEQTMRAQHREALCARNVLHPPPSSSTPSSPGPPGRPARSRVAGPDRRHRRTGLQSARATLVHETERKAIGLCSLLTPCSLPTVCE